jgi:hypothetical protein
LFRKSSYDLPKVILIDYLTNEKRGESMFRQAFIILLLCIVLGSIASSCSKKSSEPKLCATPTFNPTGGTYSWVAFVTLSTTTTDATIRYTIDGSDPTLNSLVYSDFITLLTTTTIKAQAFKSGWSPSAIATATYTIQ